LYAFTASQEYKNYLKRTLQKLYGKESTTTIHPNDPWKNADELVLVLWGSQTIPVFVFFSGNQKLEPHGTHMCHGQVTWYMVIP